MATARQRPVAITDAGGVSLQETQTGQGNSVTALRKANAEVQDARRAALNLMEDAIQSRENAETLNAALRASEERLARELAATRQLQAASALLIEGGDIRTLYQKIVDAAAVIMRSDCASMQILDDDEDALRMLAWCGFGPEFGEIFALNRPDTRTSCSAARRAGRRVIIPDVETCDFIAGTTVLEDHRKMDIWAAQSTPLFSRDGRLLGMISTHWHNPHTPTEGDLGQFDILVRQVADLFERKRSEEVLRESEERYRSLFASSPMAVFVCDRNAVIERYNQRAADFWGREPVCGVERYSGAVKLWLPDGTPLPQDRSPMAEVLRTGTPALGVELSIERPDGSRLPVLVNFAPLRNAQGEITGVIASAVDITERKQSDKHRNLLMAELDHRVKNTLATVQSIARQTSLNAASLDDFRQTFEARLMAMAQTHSLLTLGEWRSASLRKIVMAELSPYGSDKNERIAIAGEDVQLNSKQALVVGLAFHELATNAAKYGALSVPTGRVEISWVARAIEDGPILQFQWIETGGPAVGKPSRRGFGSRLLECGLRNELEAEVHLDFHPEGVRFSLQFHLDPEGPST